MTKISVGVIGGGLSGLTAAYHLKKNNIDVSIIEARERLGGRIHTHFSNTEAPIELGATWLGKKHTYLISLLSELEVDIYEQFMGKYAVYEPISTSPPQLVQMPHNPDPTFRIKGGSSVLIRRLSKQIDENDIHLHSKVHHMRSSGDKIVVHTEKHTFEFDSVIITVPPKLLIDTIEFEPELPKTIIDIGHQTQTWMSESIKVALTYAQPFWKNKQPIGSIFSNTGIISEMYDHSNFEESKFALKGFINAGFAFTSREEREKRVIAQLTRYFGAQVENFISYHETVWRNEAFTHSDYEGFLLPHQNNGNPIYRSELMGGKLIIGGSETAAAHPGYMDGAVESGLYAASKIIKALA